MVESVGAWVNARAVGMYKGGFRGEVRTGMVCEVVCVSNTEYGPALCEVENLLESHVC